MAAAEEGTGPGLTQKPRRLRLSRRRQSLLLGGGPLRQLPERPGEPDIRRFTTLPATPAAVASSTSLAGVKEARPKAEVRREKDQDAECWFRDVGRLCRVYRAPLDFSPLSPFWLSYLDEYRDTRDWFLRFKAPSRGRTADWRGEWKFPRKARNPHGNFCWEFFTGQKTQLNSGCGDLRPSVG